jgi:SHS2 domain-containing protein
MAKKSDDVKTRALNYIQDFISKVESQREQLKERWIECDKAYRVMYNPEKQAYKGESKYSSPIIQDNTEAIVSRIYEAVKISDKALDITADPNKLDYKKNVVKAMVYKQMAIKQAEQQKIDEKKEIAARMMVKYGNCIVKVPFLRETETVKHRQVITEPILDDVGNPVIEVQTGIPLTVQRVEVVEEEIVKYVGPGYEIITDLEDIYKDPFISNIEDQPIIVHRMVVDWNYIQKGVDEGRYYEDIAEKIKGNPNKKTKTNSRSEQLQGITDDSDANNYHKEYEIFETWLDFDETDDSGSKPLLVTLCNDMVLGYQDNPFWKKFKPFLESKYREIEGEAYSDGAITPVLPIYYDYNDTLNQMNDAAAFVLNPIIVEFIGNAKTKTDLRVKPGAIWPERVPNALRRFDMDVSNILASEQRLTAMEGRINRGMGTTELMNGMNDANISDADRTFRGTAKLIAQSDKKFRVIANRFEQNMWEKWLEMGFEMNAQLNDEAFLFNAGRLDEQGMPINQELSPQDVVGEFTFKVSGVESFFDKQDQMEKIALFRAQTAGAPWINTMALDKQIAEMLELKDIDSIIVPPPPSKPEVKPPNVSISMNPKDGTVIAAAVAQLLNNAGWPVDLNMAVDDANIIQKRTAPSRMVQSGLLPDKIEEDVIETKKGTTTEKMGIVTGDKAEQKEASVPVAPVAPEIPQAPIEGEEPAVIM